MSGNDAERAETRGGRLNDRVERQKTSARWRFLFPLVWRRIFAVAVDQSSRAAMKQRRGQIWPFARVSACIFRQSSCECSLAAPFSRCVFVERVFQYVFAVDAQLE